MVVKNVHIPPKLFSKAHSQPSVNRAYNKASSYDWNMTKPAEVLPRLFNVPRTVPELYVDAEGISLSRGGELSILIVHVETSHHVHTYLIHVHVLEYLAFSTASSNGIHSLRSILQDNRIPKVLFDVGMDSDALFGHYGVLLQGVIDAQVMKLAAMGGGSNFLPGLGRCLLEDLALNSDEAALIETAKKRGQELWRPCSGGSLERFNDNPLLQGIIDYCVVDAAYLPRLFEKYNQASGNRVWLMGVDDLWGNEELEEISDGIFSWEGRVLGTSRARVEMALDPSFNGGGALNPWVSYDPYDGSFTLR